MTVVHGPGREGPPAGARAVPVGTVREMDAAVRREMGGKRFDIVVMAAAAADYTVRSPRASKIKSGRKALAVRLVRAPKIIDGVRAAQPGALLVGFKAEAGVSRAELEKRALARMRGCGADMMVANLVGTRRHAKDPGGSQVTVLRAGAKPRRTGWAPKESIAAVIRSEIEACIAAAEGAAAARLGRGGAAAARPGKRHG